MRISLLHVSVVVSVLALGAACGDSGGSGGSSGEGGTTGSDTTSAGGAGSTSATTTSATTTTTTTTTTTASSSSTGGLNPDLPSSAECQTECEEGQTGQCTALTGDCATCCDAALDLAESACDGEIVAYYECIESGSPTVCDTDCTTEETAVQDCGTNFCLQNLTNPACQALLNCFE